MGRSLEQLPIFFLLSRSAAHTQQLESVQKATGRRYDLRNYTGSCGIAVVVQFTRNSCCTVGLLATKTRLMCFACRPGFWCPAASRISGPYHQTARLICGSMACTAHCTDTCMGEGEREISSAKRQRSQAGTRRMKNQSFGSRRFRTRVLCLAGFGDGSSKVVGTWKLVSDGTEVQATATKSRR